MLLGAITLLLVMQAAPSSAADGWLRKQCHAACERSDQSRSFDVTEVELHPLGGLKAGYAVLNLRLRWRGAGPAPTVAVNPYLLDLAGLPLAGGQGRPISPVAGSAYYAVTLNPDVGLHRYDVGCPRDFGERLILTIGWNGGKNTEAHLVEYGIRAPTLPCPPNTGRL